LPFNNINP